jgi:hypothetical protein
LDTRYIDWLQYIIKHSPLNGANIQWLAKVFTTLAFFLSRQNCSSSFKLDGFRWYTAICKSYHRFSIGLRFGL